MITKHNAISVVLPTCGDRTTVGARARYLDISLRSLLDQTIPFSEVVVFDTSENQEIRYHSPYRKDPRVRWESAGKKIGIVDSWNGAIALAKSEFVTIFSDDDVALPTFHAQIQEGLRRSNFVCVPFRFVDENGDPVGDVRWAGKHESMDAAVFRHRKLVHSLELVLPGNVFRKSWFERIDGFKDTFLPCGIAYDDLFWIEISTNTTTVAFARDIGFHFRIHSDRPASRLRSLAPFQESIPKYIELVIRRLSDLGTSSGEIESIIEARQDIIDGMMEYHFLRMLGVAWNVGKLEPLRVLGLVSEYAWSSVSIQNKIKVFPRTFERFWRSVARRVTKVS